MPSPAIQKTIERLSKLIDEADALPDTESFVSSGAIINPRTGSSKVLGSNVTRKGESSVLDARFAQAIRSVAPTSEYSARLKDCHHTLDYRDLALGLKLDLEDGYGDGLNELAHGEIFDDQLDQAQELLDGGFLVAAAVTAGSVGEAHLKRLALKHGVAITKPDGSPLKASKINEDLAKVPAYDPTTAKHVTAWQGTRNDAAHGDAAKITKSLVENLIHGLRRFMADYSA